MWRRTSGMTTFAKKKSAYDPSRQWGLKPDMESGTSGATYVVSGHIVSDRKESSGLFVNETLGRDAQAKAARKMSAKDADRALEELLKRDKEGMKAVKVAREFGRKLEREKEGKEQSGRAGKSKGKEKAKEDSGKTTRRDENLGDHSSDEEFKKPVKNAYSATLVRNLGFDPTAKDGRKVKDAEVQKKVWGISSRPYPVLIVRLPAECSLCAAEFSERDRTWASAR